MPSGAGAGLVRTGHGVRAVLRGSCSRKLPVADGEAKQDLEPSGVAQHPFF